MFMKQHKQFKIGEYAIGGIIDVLINENEISIQCLDYNTQEKVVGMSFDSNGVDADYSIIETLNEYTSYYYAEQVFDWIKQFVSFKQSW
jgi:hypothetical protein